MAPGLDTQSICKGLLKLVERNADLIHVPFVEEAGPIKRELASAGLYRLPIPIDALSIERKCCESFDDLLRTYSSNFRMKLRQGRKRMKALGTPAFELSDAFLSSAETIDWVLIEKQAWLADHGKENIWFFRPETRNFLIGASLVRSTSGRLGLFRLTLDGEPVAALLTTIDNTRIEMLITSFDKRYARCSPGMLLIEEVTRWGMQRGLVCDMRTLRSDFKERWANSTSRRVSYFAPLSLKGALFFAPTYLKFRAIMALRQTLNDRQVTTVKQMAAWFVGHQQNAPR